jgi:hypothetical protein
LRQQKENRVAFDACVNKTRRQLLLGLAWQNIVQVSSQKFTSVFIIIYKWVYKRRSVLISVLFV